MIKTLLLTAALTVTSVSAQESSDSIMLDMIDYITEHSDLSYNGEALPFIEMQSMEEACEAMYAKPYSETESWCQLGGYYNHNLKTIYLVDEITEGYNSDKYYDMVILHELVHYLQDINGRYDEVQCKAKLEVLAYRLQEQYMREFGFPEENLPDPFTVFFATKCPEEFSHMGGHP